MKALFSILILLILFSACEEKVDIALPEGPKKMVVEATAIQYEDAEIAQLNVRLSKTAGFYQENTPPVSDAEIQVVVNDSIVPINPNDSIAGVYSGLITIQRNTIYRLEINVDNEFFTSETQLASGAAIDSVLQNEGGGFDPELIGVDVLFTDAPQIGNCYFFEYQSTIERVLNTICDDQINGNQFAAFYAEEFETGDSLTIRIQGIDERFQNYFSLVSQQSSEGGNPFATAPATARGNIVNETNPDEKALGYFRISQEYSRIFIFE